MNTTVRKARKRAGVAFTRKPVTDRGPKRLPVGLVDARDPHGYIKGSLTIFLVVSAAVAGYLVKWLVG